jgi:hypothetical protein
MAERAIVEDRLLMNYNPASVEKWLHMMHEFLEHCHYHTRPQSDVSRSDIVDEAVLMSHPRRLSSTIGHQATEVSVPLTF